MFTVSVDLGDLEGAAERFQAAYKAAVDQMKAVLDEKAATERASHGYQNRTGDLERSTFASEIQPTGDGHQVELGARMSYAGYVADRGLMSIEALAAEAEVEIGTAFESIAKAV